MTNNPLKYSEYKIEQGLWLQQKYSENKSPLRKDPDVYSLQYYSDYLRVVGVENIKIYNTLNKYLNDLVNNPKEKDRICKLIDRILIDGILYD